MAWSFLARLPGTLSDQNYSTAFGRPNSFVLSVGVEEEAGGIPILEEGKVLMELKCSGGIPLWMTHILTELHIYKTSFSKYGTFYVNHIYPRLKEDFRHGNII